MKGPILVLLAAGIGSRYGGLKQMDRLGKNGEVLLDYSVYDAVKSGFEKIVFIIRHDIEKDFRELVAARMGAKVNWELAFQDPDSLIPQNIFEKAQKAGRTKPWGTAHALLCAADKIDAPFAVINADDFYGRGAFEAIGKYLRGPCSGEPVIVPYRLDKTLSPQGTVARGLCEIKDGYLVTVEELTAIAEKDGVVFNTNADGSTRRLAPDSPVSMNFWGFPPSILPEFKKYFDGFLETFAADIPGQIKNECFIPKAADHFIKQGIAKIKVLRADSDWFGVTYREDREAAVKKLAELTRAGVYPESLWQGLPQ
jgi:dTDP-glucose pyrophosphorylase